MTPSARSVKWSNVLKSHPCGKGGKDIFSMVWVAVFNKRVTVREGILMSPQKIVGGSKVDRICVGSGDGGRYTKVIL